MERKKKRDGGGVARGGVDLVDGVLNGAAATRERDDTEVVPPMGIRWVAPGVEFILW